MEFLRNETAGEVDWTQLREELREAGFRTVTVPGKKFGIFYPFNTGWSADHLTGTEKDAYALSFMDFLEARGFRFLETQGLGWKGGLLFRLPETYTVEVFDCDGTVQKRHQDRGECSCSKSRREE